jgi:hypothetical protein
MLRCSASGDNAMKLVLQKPRIIIVQLEASGTAAAGVRVPARAASPPTPELPESMFDVSPEKTTMCFRAVAEGYLRVADAHPSRTYSPPASA